ncbi:hypothetical protein [Vibrio crassostreae]|uniref:hypothetical protein n=1 Tax=Vibrio crassostreae TaxID=246167 RepID=UPI001B316797|nr:hypothetical protein [Vibrio crassostreae]CAK3024844.1 exported hypothetical protein [Vibrio crassostreae]
MILKKNSFLFLLIMSVSFSVSAGIKIDSGVNAGEVYETTSAYIEVMTNKCLSFSSYGQPNYKYFTSGTANSVQFSFRGSTYVDSGCTDIYNSSYLMTKSYSKAECEAPKSYNEEGLCEESSCSDSKGKDAPFPQGPLPDDDLSMGASRLSCNTGNMCEVLSGYRAANDRIIKDSFYTGEDCVGNSNDYANCPYYGSCDGQSPPEPDDLEEPWNGCKKPYIDQPFVCREDTDGDGRPNPDAPYDDAAICDYDSSGKFSCRLGSFDNDKPTDPIEPTEPDGDVSHGGNIPDAAGDPATIEPVEPPPEVTEPELTPDSNGDIVKAVTSMNSDFNKALNDLNIDINQSQANINTELDRLNKNVVNNSNATRDLAQTNIDIYNNTKQLIQGVEVAVKTGTASTVEAINTNGENTVNAVNDGFTGMGESLEKIEGSLDALTNVDTGSAGTSGSCIETDTCTGFYTSGYPDGLSGVANAHFESIKTNVLDGFVNTFGSLDLSNAKRPNFSIPILDFGSYSIEDYLNLDWIFGFVRFCLIFTAIATARKNILGG